MKNKKLIGKKIKVVASKPTENQDLFDLNTVIGNEYIIVNADDYKETGEISVIIPKIGECVFNKGEYIILD